MSSWTECAIGMWALIVLTGERADRERDPGSAGESRPREDGDCDSAPVCPCRVLDGGLRCRGTEAADDAASLSTIVNADEICVLSGGKIVERGRWFPSPGWPYRDASAHGDALMSSMRFRKFEDVEQRV